MKAIKITVSVVALIAMMLIISCSSPISLTSWKNPDDHSRISKVVIIPLFAKLEYVKPFEQSMGTYFSNQGLKTIGSLEFLNPTKTYTVAALQQKVDSLGADGVLLFEYKGTDKDANYVPATYYGGFGTAWGYGGGFYGGGFYGGGVYSGGYWMTTSTVNVKALLYNVKNTTGAIWTADISVTDPQYVDQSAVQIAQKIYADWVSYGLIKAVAGK
jgi:hypothetical protein